MNPSGWVRDRSVATKVMSAVLLAVLALLVVGAYGVRALGSVSADTTTLYRQGLRPYEVLADLRDMQGDTRVAMRDYALATSAKERAALRADMKVTDRQLDQDIKAYLVLGGDQLGARRGLMKTFQAAMVAFREIRDTRLLPAVDRGDTRAVKDLFGGDLDRANEATAAPMDKLLPAEDAAAKRQQAAAQATYRFGRALLLVLLLVGALGASALGFLVSRGISRPVRDVMDVLVRVSHGDLTGHVAARSADEVGRMGTALNTAITTLHTIVETLTRNAASVAGSSRHVAAVSREIEHSAQDVSAQAGAVLTAAEEISSSVQTVADGASEMGDSIHEIARNASDAAEVASGAVRSAELANARVARLGESSAEISSVVKVITTIARQTNLLALNATIEAARAGEAGKGFAVVATEVKELARETAQATEDIARRISAMQVDSNDTIEAIAEIGAVIDRISDYTTSIAAAVEQQTATTNEMARSVAQVATGSGRIAGNIHGVAEAAAKTTTAVQENHRTADELSGMSVELTALIAQFTV
jgi:methyl-accepting chemotaxis protein